MKTDGLPPNGARNAWHTHHGVPSSYVKPKQKNPAGYVARPRKPQVASEAPQLSGKEHVRRALAKLRDPRIEDELSSLFEGREERFLAHYRPAQALVRALTRDDNQGAEAAVRDFLDELFVDLVDDQVFARTGTVILILYALKAATTAAFNEIASVFATSRAAEIAQISRYAAALLRT